MDGWDPMAEDFENVTFNSYATDQIGAHLPLNSLISFKRKAKSETGVDKVESDQSLTLYIDGFPSDLTDTGLKNFLQRIGCRLSSVKVLRNRDKNAKYNKPIGFVEFESAMDAQKALQLIKNQTIFKLFAFFISSEREAQLKEQIMDKEFDDFALKLYKQNNEMRINGEISHEEEPKVFARYKSLRYRKK